MILPFITIYTTYPGTFSIVNAEHISMIVNVGLPGHE